MDLPLGCHMTDAYWIMEHIVCGRQSPHTVSTALEFLLFGFSGIKGLVNYLRSRKVHKNNRVGHSNEYFAI